MLITQLLPLSIILSLSLSPLLIPPSSSPLPLSELDWSSASSLWNHLPVTAAGGENINSSSCTLKCKTAATRVEKANKAVNLGSFSTLWMRHHYINASVHSGTEMLSCSLTSEMII